MRILLQRVTQASVTVEDRRIAEIGAGLVILVCAMPGDTEQTAEGLAGKIARLRIFRDAAGKANLNILQSGGAALVVSQFTLAADTARGTRPGFSRAAPPEVARDLYGHFVHSLGALDVPVRTGAFGAEMAVALVNDGPMTIWLDSQAP